MKVYYCAAFVNLEMEHQTITVVGILAAEETLHDQSLYAFVDNLKLSRFHRRTIFIDLLIDILFNEYTLFC